MPMILFVSEEGYEMEMAHALRIEKSRRTKAAGDAIFFWFILFLKYNFARRLKCNRCEEVGPAEAGAPPGPGEPGGAAYGKGGGNQVTAKQKTTVGLSEGIAIE